MDVDYIAQRIEDLLQLNAESSSHLRGGQYCLTLAPESESPWIQVKTNTLHFHYPHSDDPLPRLRAAGVHLPESAGWVNLAPNTAATIEFAMTTAHRVAEIVAEVFLLFFNCPPDLRVRGMIVSMHAPEPD